MLQYTAVRNYNTPTHSETIPYTQDVLGLELAEDERQATVTTRQLGKIAISILHASTLGPVRIYEATSPSKEDQSILQLTLYNQEATQKASDINQSSRGVGEDNIIGEIRLIAGSWPIS